jgi:hypothetical protein
MRMKPKETDEEFFAKKCKAIYQSLIRQGFSCDEALKILLAVLKKDVDTVARDV